jgi:hypothetical protein
MAYSLIVLPVMKRRILPTSRVSVGTRDMALVVQPEMHKALKTRRGQARVHLISHCPYLLMPPIFV